MSVTHYLAFIAITEVLLIIPGPTILTVIGYSVSHGRRATVPLIAAVGLGDATAVTVSLLGLGALLEVSAFWFTLVRLSGGIYLLYIGLKSLYAGVYPPRTSAPTLVSGRRLFSNTYLVTALNPKSITFFVAFLPQFVYGKGDVVAQLWLMAVTFVVLAMINAAVYTSVASAASRRLSTPRTQRGFQLAGGGILTAAGTWALLAKRHT